MNILSLFSAALCVANSAFAAEKSGLTLDVYNANSNSLYVNSTLIYGEIEAPLVNTGFTKADALRIAVKVLDSGKQLNTLFISHADPDYYFSAEVPKGEMKW